jgi:hypothetical protein
LKTCSYCGRDNDDNRQNCFECGTELDVVCASEALPRTSEARDCIFCGTANPAGSDSCSLCGNALVAEHPEGDSFQEDPEAADIPEIELEFEVDHGFSHPDWKKLWRRVKEDIPRNQWDTVYRKAARIWLRQLCHDLGGNYRCYESRRFFFMCAEGRRASEVLLECAENSQEFISDQIGKLRVREVFGKQMILVFSEADDYYAYISHFYPEGTHNLSAGIFVSKGYGHVAIPLAFVFSTKRIITHELVHNALFHLPVPTWLHEGLAQRLDRHIVNRAFHLDRELAERHAAHWNAENLQEFWAGTSFHKPGEETELSYSLGEILVELLAEDYPAFIDFVREADWRDGGQDAAMRILAKDLEEVLAGFLGSGDWRPKRKRIRELTEPKSASRVDDGNKKLGNGVLIQHSLRDATSP